MLTMISHFNGIGLFPFAAAQAGIVTVATTEIDPFCNAISRQWFPHAEQHTDIRSFSFGRYVDIICGGDPCQPHSSAGKRKGSADARFLWPEMLRSIDEGRPAWVVNENVAGSVTNDVLDGKAADLEAIGYACQAFDLPAGAFGAPHLRRRIVLVAHTMRTGRGQQHAPAFPAQEAERHVRYGAQRPAFVGAAARDADTPALLRMADGSAAGMDPAERNARIKALGNAIDPQVFMPIFQAIAAIEAPPAL